MTVFVFAMYVLAVARITRLINYDAAFNPLRNAFVRVFNGHYLAAYFIACPWCVGLWVCLATAWAPIWHADNPVAQYLAVSLAASFLIGIASPLSEDEDLIVEGVEDDEHA